MTQKETRQDNLEENFDLLDEIDDLDKAIIRLTIEGIRPGDIAERLGRGRTTVSKRLNKYKVQQAIKELQKNALQILLESQTDAARELRRILKTGTDENKIKAAREILKGVLSENINIKLNDPKIEAKLQEIRDKVKSESD